MKVTEWAVGSVRAFQPSRESRGDIVGQPDRSEEDETAWEGVRSR